MKFNCSSCGACCKRIGLLKDKFKELNFPYDVNEKGWCTMLDENNKCKVYENRPVICSVEKTFDMYIEKMGMTRMQAYLSQAKSCNQFIKEDKLHEKYLIDEKVYS